MNARQHLAAVIAAIQKTGVSLEVRHQDSVAAIHAAANFLQIPELSPKSFHQDLCLRLQARANAQQLPSKGIKRTRAYIEGVAGAIAALDVLGNDLMNPTLALFVLLCARGGDVVDHIAAGEPI